MATDAPAVELISTPRLELVSMTVPFMAALARGDLDAAAREVGASVSSWLRVQLEHFVAYRLGQLQADPAIQPWLGRVMVLTLDDGARRVVGSVGFHGPPDEAGRLEVGYSVDPDYRRRGFAIEAVRALFDWAHEQHGVRRFLASVRPDNAASLELISRLGFHKVGEQLDPIDGLELVFEADWPQDAIR